MNAAQSEFSADMHALRTVQCIEGITETSVV